MAYNPNDCVELRWGARAKSADSDEVARAFRKTEKAFLR
jgi:hypothetical protein